LLAFDVVEFDGVRVAHRPLCERRRLLENLLSDRPACLQLVEQTDHCELAEQWLTLIPSLEGVVAKRRDSRYAPGRREWVKVKRQRTADCVVIGVVDNDTAPSLVLGLRHADGELHHFGVTRPSRTALSEPCAPILDVLADEHSIRSRWQHEAVPAWQRVKPSAVCEVGYTLLDSGRWLRQPATFLRWRVDRDAEDCSLDQLSGG
jgi:ATP-dependent DNA ligase